MPGPLIAAPLIAKAADGLIEAGKAFIRRKWPDPAEAAAREREWEEVVANLDLQALQGFRDFIVAYEGAAADTHWSIQVLRGIVRPVLTFYLVGLLTWAIYSVQPPDIIQLVWTLNLLALGFWFGERALQRLGLNGDTIKSVTETRARAAGADA